MTRKHVFLTVAAATAMAAGPARSADPPAPQPVLPDLRQFLPAHVKAQSVNGEWRLGFDSEVGNDGPGYLRIRGTKPPGPGPMTADQVLEMDDGGETTVPGIGTMHYVVGGGHEHWHLLDFERYELRSADSSETLVTDQKTGFCLADAFTTDQCGRNRPDYTSVEEGLDSGGSDRYIALLEGQYLILSQATVPDGDYLLVHRVNPTGALQVTNPGNDAATLRLNIVWNGGTPNATVTNSCLASTTCPPPPHAPPPPDPTPGPQPPAATGNPAPVAPGPALPGPEPQPVPILPPTTEAPVASRASMSREMAVRLARQAIRKSSKQTPRKFRMVCGRMERAEFSCRGTWRATGSGVWRGNVRVWYRLTRGQLNWFYDLSAERKPDGKRLRTRATRGSASAVMFASADGSLLCRRIDAA